HACVDQRGLVVAGSAPAPQVPEAELLLDHLAGKARELAELFAGDRAIPDLHAYASDSDGWRLAGRHAETSSGCTRPCPGSGSGSCPSLRKWWAMSLNGCASS